MGLSWHALLEHCQRREQVAQGLAPESLTLDGQAVTMSGCTARSERPVMAHRLVDLVGDAILGIDTLWGGDVLAPSGAARCVADSWFSREPLPRSYAHETAARLRDGGGVAAASPDSAAVDAYLAAVDIPGAIAGLAEEAREASGLRGAYLDGLVICLVAMWDLAMEAVGRGEAVPYARCVRASTGADPVPSEPADLRERVGALISHAGYRTDNEGQLLAAVDAWRQDRLVPRGSLAALAAAFIARLDALAVRHVVPLLPQELHAIPRANVRFLPIRDAWFSGSMNYLGRAQGVDGAPQYEATYEINSSITISVPEFEALISHEVVPGHVTAFAYLQNLYVRGRVAFEGTVLTMCTRGAALHEGLANNAVLLAHGVADIADLPDDDLKIGVLLGLLQDEAKNQASYLTWNEGWPQAEVAPLLRKDCLVSAERADKLAGAWGRHPLLGRMYLPAYRAGTRRVAELRRQHPATAVVPALYGCRGLVDLVTIERAIRAD
jgi:hypothetical protein